MKLIFLSNFFQNKALRTFSTNQKAEIWMFGTKLWNNSTQQVNSCKQWWTNQSQNTLQHYKSPLLHHALPTLPVDQSAYYDDGYLATVTATGIRCEISRVDCIGDDRDDVGVEGGPQHSVLLAGVGHTYNVVGVAQRHSKQFIGQHGAEVSESEERVVCEHGVETHGLGMEQSIMGHGWEGAVGMHHSDTLTHEHTPEKWQAMKAGGGRGLVIHHLREEVIKLSFSVSGSKLNWMNLCSNFKDVLLLRWGTSL